MTEHTTAVDDSPVEGYPDDHPVLRGHLLSIVQNGQAAQYVSRELWEETAAERDELRRVLMFISAWRLTSGTCDTELDQLLARVGEDYSTARAALSVINWARSEAAKRSTG